MSFISDIWGSVKSGVGKALGNTFLGPVNTAVAGAFNRPQVSLMQNTYASTPVQPRVASNVATNPDLSHPHSYSNSSLGEYKGVPITAGNISEQINRIDAQQNQGTPQMPPPFTPPDPSNNFKIDTSTITSDHLARDNTPSSVMNDHNQYTDAYNKYLTDISPYQESLAGATQYSPEYIDAYNKILDTNQGLRGGIENIRNAPIPLSVQVGQEAHLNRDTALTQEANAENMGLQETMRKNRIDTLNSVIGSKEKNYEANIGAIKNNNDLMIQLGQLGISQQSVDQGKYDFQQITDPNTGFPTIKVIDKQTGQEVGNVTPGGSQGNQGTDQGLGSAATNVFSSLGIQQDVPLSQAVQQYGIDNIIHAMVGNEGGSPGGVYNNPGNVKFMGLPGQVDSGVQASDGGTFASYRTSQMGQNAIASIIMNAASGKSQAYGQSPTLGSFVGTYTNTAPANNQGNSFYGQIASSAPPLIANAIKPLPDGSAYIDSSLLADPKYNVMATQYANKMGIKVLSSADANAINTVTQSIKNMQVMANTFGDLAHNTATGGKFSNITDPLSKFFDTNYGSQLKAYQSNRDGLFQQIRALAGSSPRLNMQELMTAANALPTLNEFNKDTLKDGINKLVKTQSYLDNAIQTFIPSYVGTPVNIGGQYAVLGSDGKTYTFPDNSSALQFLKADNI